MIREAISQVTTGATLSENEAAVVMDEIMTGVATQAQMGAFLTALHLRPGNETVQEITGLARVMRQKAVRVHLKESIATQAIDTCGTGGDRAGTFNVSTAAGIVAAAAGASVAKHGNRSATSNCGSAESSTGGRGGAVDMQGDAGRGHWLYTASVPTRWLWTPGVICSWAVSWVPRRRSDSVSSP